VKKWLIGIKQGESGLALPMVLVMMVLGSLVIVPTLNYVTTSLKAGEMVEEKVEGLYAADAGIEDALWRIKNDKPVSFPYSYQLTDVNGMSVSVVIDEITTISGEEVGSSGGHQDWLVVTKSIIYDAGIYSYEMSISNNGTGNVKIEKILIDFPPQLGYVDGSTGGDITADDPEVNGLPDTGITLIWDMSPPYPTIPDTETRVHTFQLNGPPDVEGVEGYGFVQATRDDIGTVWVEDFHPYSIIAQAKNATDTVVTTIRAGVWEGGELEISCWQINP